MIARAQATNRHYQLGDFSPQRLRSQALNRFYHLGTYSGPGAAAQQAVERRSQEMNRAYHLGAFSSTAAAVRQAVERRGQAMNRAYHLGTYAAVGTSSTFDWSNVGIGAGGFLALLVLAGGMTVLVRRRTEGPASPSTT